MIPFPLAAIFLKGRSRDLILQAAEVRTLFWIVIWLTIFTVPLIPVYTEEVHLCYSVLPFSLLITFIADRILFDLKHQQNASFRPLANGLYIVMILILWLGLIDLSLNMLNSARIVNQMYGGIKTMSSWLKNHVPEGSYVVSNALHLYDIQLYSNDHFISYWTVRSGIPSHDKGLETREELMGFLNSLSPDSHVYFLDMDQVYHPGKVNYHPHRFVRTPTVPIEYLGNIHTTRIRYPFIDPVKMFIPREYTNVLFPPDLENDFYRGPAKFGTLPFMREVYVEYDLYQVDLDSIETEQ